MNIKHAVTFVLSGLGVAVLAGCPIYSDDHSQRVCVGGQCYSCGDSYYSSDCSGFTCNTGSDCPSGYDCDSNGQCSASTDASTGSCTKPSDCAAGSTCGAATSATIQFGNTTTPTYGVDQGSYPMARTITVGIQAGF